MRNPVGRLEAFSDGVFAIAITLLILEIKVPHASEVHSSAELWSKLIHLWPSFFAFIFSFGGILISWANHHNLFNKISKSSMPFLYANGLLLLSITFLPFPTSLLAEYIQTDQAQPAISLYCFTSVMNSVSWVAIFFTIQSPVVLIDTKYAPYLASSKRNLYFGVLIYVCTFVLSFWMPYTALAINFSLWILWTVISFTSHDA